MDTPDLSTLAKRVAHLLVLAASPTGSPLAASRLSILAGLGVAHVGAIVRGRMLDVSDDTAMALARTVLHRARASEVEWVARWIRTGFGSPPHVDSARQGIKAAERRLAAKNGTSRTGRALRVAS